MASLVRYNKENPLVLAAVRRYPDLIPRAFVILSVLYGLYSSPPSKLGVVKDFAGMLDKDLDENEARVRAYAKIRRGGTFFSKLSKVWEMIRAIYSSEHYIPGALPPTPYHAYALYVLNNSELLEQNISTEELFSRMVVHHSGMKKIAEIARTSTPAESPGPLRASPRSPPAG